MNILKIALRNLTRQKRRSIFLVVAIAFAFFVVVFMDGMSVGALKSISGEISKMVGGHVYIMGAQEDPDKQKEDKKNSDKDEESKLKYMMPKDIEFIEKIVKDLNIDSLHTVRRSQDFGKLIFEGKELNTQIHGCDFKSETLLQDSILFKEGSWEGMKKENAILLSESAAKELNASYKDIILFETKTMQGQLTVVEFQIEGISVDRSAFAGISSYANLSYLQKIAEKPAESTDSYSIFLKNFDKQEEYAAMLEKKIKEKAPVVSRDLAKQISPSSPANEIIKQTSKGKWKGTKFGVAAFYDFAPGIITFMNALSMISFGILVVLLFITMIGISNTFKIIVYERRGEIGTMRSCGVRKNYVRYLFLAEASLLSFFGAVCGFILAVLVMQIISFIPIPITSNWNAFSKNGYMSWNLSAGSVLLKFLIMFILTLLTVRGSASRAANMIPAEALRQGK